MDAKRVLKKIYMVIYNLKLLLKFKKIGKNCLILKGSRINKPECIELGNNVRIGINSRISCFKIFNGEKLFPKVEIGDNVYIGDYFSILAADTVKIRSNVLIASYVMITSENHGIDPELGSGYGKQSLKTKPILIEEGVWIGEKVSILPGVTIGEKSIIGTGSVVTNDIPSYSIAVGSPAKVIKKYDFLKKQWINI